MYRVVLFCPYSFYLLLYNVSPVTCILYNLRQCMNVIEMFGSFTDALCLVEIKLI